MCNQLQAAPSKEWSLLAKASLFSDLALGRRNFFAFAAAHGVRLSPGSAVPPRWRVTTEYPGYGR